jgi:hypothetical protein
MTNSPNPMTVVDISEQMKSIFIEEYWEVNQFGYEYKLRNYDNLWHSLYT